MNSLPNRHDPAIDERAAHWAARLDGEVLQAAERAELDTWLAQSPAHRAALAEYCQLSADLEEHLPRLVASGAIAFPPLTAPRRPRVLPRFAAATLAVAAAIALLLWFGRPTPASPAENFASATAQRPAFTLADGTHVQLNAGTTLRFEQTPSGRLARLAGGEAFFAVAKDPARPFVVETPTGSVRVTGTTFNVRADPASFEVTVVEGSVDALPSLARATRASDGPFALRAGDQLLARPDTVSRRPLSASALEDALAWRHGLAVFRDTPLREAAALFSRYHGRPIAIAPAIADERIGGRFALDDFDGFLRGMESALDLVLTHDASTRAATLAPRRAP